LVIFPFLYAGLGQLLGQDTDWDLQNYHFVDSYWVLVNHMRDTAPAQLQTYLSPVLDIPFYYAVEHLPPRLTGFLLGLVQGLSFPLLYLINRHFTRQRLVALGLAALGMFTAGALAEVGTIFGDALLAPVFFAAILLGLMSFDASRAGVSPSVRPRVLLVCAGALAGLAAGLKFAELPIALGTALAFLLAGGTVGERVRRTTWAAGALVAGVVVSYGWWGYELATRYGNPVLPYLNQIFRSSYAPSTSNSGSGLGLFDILFYPFVWTLHPAEVSGLSFREWSMPVVEILIVAAVAIAAIRSALLRRYVRVFSNDKQRYIVGMAVISYFVWVLQFNQYRFLIPMEMLSFTLIFVCLQSICSNTQRESFVVIGTVAMALVCVLSEQPMNWGRSAWSRSYFSVSLPRALGSHPASVLMVGRNPDGFVVPFFPSEDYFAQIEGNLPPTPYVRTLIHKNASAYADTWVMWENQISPSSGLFATVESAVEPYGYEVSWPSCVHFAAHVGADPEELHACELRKIALSAIAPLTQMVLPASGQRVAGRQVLGAVASSAAGLRNVQFVITGQGRRSVVTAARWIAGWLGVWQTTSVPNGVYTVHVIAYGLNGRVSESRGIVVDVANGGHRL
jgi:hypothetical protein